MLQCSADMFCLPHRQAAFPRRDGQLFGWGAHYFDVLNRVKSLACALLLILAASLLPSATSAIEPARDLAADAAAVRPGEQTAGTTSKPGRPILLFVTQPGCPYCDRARRQYLRHMAKDPQYVSRVLMREVSIAAHLKDFDGHRVSGQELATRYAIRLFPTIVLVDEAGRLIAPPLIGFTVPDFYAAYVEERIATAEKTLTATP